MSVAAQDTEVVVFDGQPLDVEAIDAIARGRRRACLSSDQRFRDRIDAGARAVLQLLADEGVIYGVTTGYGASCTVPVPPSQIVELPHHLYAYHGVGMGRLLDAEETRAVLAARLASLCQGMSGVRHALLQQIEVFLRHDILPCIPAEGSVGASGDLTPLSYVAAALCGERDVLWQGRRMPAIEALQQAGVEPLALQPKEGLAIMNGTAVMTALACLAWQRAQRCSRIATRLTALNVFATAGNPHHFDALLFDAKPHPGPRAVARWLRRDLACADAAGRNPARLQDRYSLRCAPHVIGVLEDALPFTRSLIENELNSANDNPLIDAVSGRVLHGGHFYGGHVAFAMDSLKIAIANVLDLLDRQLALLVDSRFSHGLPDNLSAATADRSAINHGLKALQIAVSAWTAEALKATVPASVFSRSTECHNQDKVSMGTIAARDCQRILDLGDQVLAALLIAARQAVTLRLRIDGGTLPPVLAETQAWLETQIPLVVEDRALDRELISLVNALRDSSACSVLESGG
ncbi:histidine ammonia-lyase [Methyloversatilis sp.]|uniref:HAL/PAL/TAL family ammonia-lyase n=1 Tax=Methyloversatilis sp. TaxID=2569862 RepID=UPI002733C13E|nr:aromatic amino acid ammonia-lyase [Methyloversatilis sp.]MDP3455090.1 aromatic amino acid ammonia-lyase [Methyloversatilis sp.]MDP3577265.1 aromatic amino acid ammonia-lyase [Methyloversatilis sp.]